MEGDIQDSTMLRDEMWFVVEKIKVGGVAGSGECVRGHNLDRFEEGGRILVFFYRNIKTIIQNIKTPKGQIKWKLL